MITANEISQLLYILISLYFFSPGLRLFEGCSDRLIVINKICQISQKHSQSISPQDHIFVKDFGKMKKRTEEGFSFYKLCPSFL